MGVAILATATALLFGPSLKSQRMLENELEQLEVRVQRLLAAFRQARLERRKALQERDRLVEMNNELRKRIETVVDRIRSLEAEQDG